MRRSYRSYDDYPRFPRSRPRAAKGGIKSQTRQGQNFGTSWWARRWVAVLEGFDIGARLGRGRTYARKGQVLSIKVGRGKVEATVQGSRPQPYAITIKVKALAEKEWAKVVKALSGEALFVAKLLAGEMPEDIEKVFKAAKLSLFPEALEDLQTACSCPDYSNPCKHIAAVYYLLGEEFDRDPFLLFQLRGLGREDLFRQLNAASPPAEALPEAAGPEGPGQPEAQTAEPLPADAGAFWSAGPVPDEVFGEVEVPKGSAAWPKRLGNFPFWRGEERFLDALEPLYRRAAQRGLATFLGERKT